MTAGVLLAVVSVPVIMTIFKKNLNLPFPALRGIQLLPVLILMQMILGFLMQIFGSKPVLQLLHLWFAAILFGILFMIQLDLKRGEPRQS
jgi:heme A synthase